MIFNEEFITDEGSFCNDNFYEVDRTPIYRDAKTIGKEYWYIALANFIGNGYPARYCIEFYKAVYNGEGIPNINDEYARISIFEPTYIILPDRHYNLTNKEVIRFDNIMSSNWDSFMKILNNEMSFDKNLYCNNRAN